MKTLVLAVALVFASVAGAQVDSAHPSDTTLLVARDSLNALSKSALALAGRVAFHNDLVSAIRAAHHPGGQQAISQEEIALRQLAFAAPDPTPEIHKAQATAVRLAELVLQRFSQGAGEISTLAAGYDAASKFSLAASPFGSPTFTADYKRTSNIVGAVTGALASLVALSASPKNQPRFAVLGVVAVPVARLISDFASSSVGVHVQSTAGKISPLSEDVADVNRLLTFNQQTFSEATRVTALMHTIATSDTSLSIEMARYDTSTIMPLLKGTDDQIATTGGPVIDKVLGYFDRFYALRNQMNSAVDEATSSVAAMKDDTLYKMASSATPQSATSKIAKETVSNIDNAANAQTMFTKRWKDQEARFYILASADAAKIGAFQALASLSP